jgi:hypothetical protein
VTSPADPQLCSVGEVSAHGAAPAPAAGDAGNFILFGFAVGVDRVGQAGAMRAHGPGTVDSELTDLVERP